MLELNFLFEIYPQKSDSLEFEYLELGICPLAGDMEFKNIKSLRSCPVAKTSPSGKRLGSPSTDGWQTPDAPNNIIHVRLATGSVVEQMNAHPFAKLHTALTHNGETTNYEALKQRVEQFRGWDKISSSFYF